MCLFIGTVTYYCDVWPWHLYILVPLTNITGKVILIWNTINQQAFDAIKVLILHPKTSLKYSSHQYYITCVSVWTQPLSSTAHFAPAGLWCFSFMGLIPTHQTCWLLEFWCNALLSPCLVLPHHVTIVQVHTGWWCSPALSRNHHHAPTLTQPILSLKFVG